MKQSEDIRDRGFCAGFFHRGFVRSSAWVLLGAALSLAGCSKDLAEGPAVGDSEIAASASLPAGLEAESSTKAPVDGSAQTTLYFARSDESSSGVWGSYGTTALNASRAAGTGSRTLTFSSKQYYQTSGLKTRMVGWYPSATSYVNGVVNWTIDGTQDILLAPAQEGSKTAAMPAFTFSHKLTQLQFYCYAENQAAVNQWGRITAIRVVGQRRNCAYATATDAFAFSGSTVSLTVPGLSASTPPVGEASAKGYGQPMMIEPKTADTQLYLEIDTENKSIRLSLPVRIYEAGKSAKVMLYFRQVGCSVACEQQEWVTIDVTSDDVGTHKVNSYPYVIKGNTIVVKDSYAQADPDAYPTHEPWSVTPAHTESAWDANASGYNTVGEMFQVANVNAVGKDGSSATMTWYEASGTTDATYNSAGYSACAQYSEAADQSDRGSWRLPTIRELKLIYAQGRQLVSNLYSLGYYWSATEESTNVTIVKVVYFQNGNVANSAKQANTNYRVCCVRDTKVAPIRSDYPKVVNGNTIVVEDFAGRADPAKYPVHDRWLVTPRHSISANDIYYEIFESAPYGRKFRVAEVDAVGKDWRSATMTWYEASGTTDATYNSAGYSACAEYSEAADQSDRGSWRLPTISEIMLIYKKRGELMRFTFSGDYWAATESSDNDGYADILMQRNGNMAIRAFNDESQYVRCVRDL